jgi:hypothetical protein
MSRSARRTHWLGAAAAMEFVIRQKSFFGRRSQGADRREADDHDQADTCCQTLSTHGPAARTLGVGFLGSYFGGGTWTM